MAYLFATASQRYLSVSSAPATAAPLTISAWFKYPSTGANQTIAGVNAVGTGSTHSLRLAVNASNFLAATAVVNATAYSSLYTGSYTPDSISHGCAVFASSTSRTAYLNGIAATSSTTSATPSGINQLQIGAHVAAAGGQAYANGWVAEVGFWSAALSASEITSLANGASPRLVRPQSLIFYAPLIRDLVDVRGGLSISNINSATVTDHPRIYA